MDLPKEEKKEMRVWDLHEINKFVSKVKHHRYYIAYLIAIFTGMRKGEILGLRWKDIDFEKKVIYIRQVLDSKGKGFKVGAKTVSSVRSIHIPSNLVEYLNTHMELMQQEKLKFGMKYSDFDLVVCTKYGNPVDPASLTRRFQKQVNNIGLPFLRFHDLRHTHATMLIQQNVNAKVISERLGHSSIQITLDRYSHVLPSMQQQVADKLDEIIVL